MSAVAVGVWATAGGCGFATDPAERPLEGNWLGAVALIDGGVSWQLWLREDGQGNVSGRVSRTDFRRIPHPAEQVSDGTVSGVHEPSRVLLTLDYGESRGALRRSHPVRRSHHRPHRTRYHRPEHRHAGIPPDRHRRRRDDGRRAEPQHHGVDRPRPVARGRDVPRDVATRVRRKREGRAAGTPRRPSASASGAERASPAASSTRRASTCFSATTSTGR